MYVLDTNILSDYLIANRNYEHLKKRIDETDPSLIYLTVITAVEYLHAVLPHVRIGNEPVSFKERIKGHERFVETIKALGRFSILTYDESADDVWRRFPQKIRNRGADSRIAAITVAHGFTLVTRNQRHFEDTGVTIVDWTLPPLRVT